MAQRARRPEGTLLHDRRDTAVARRYLRQAGIPIVETGGLDGTPVDMLVSYFNKEATRDLCEGCRRCMKVCQFGAIGFSAATRKTAIDPRRCYGCGICRAVCKTNAITLRDRRQSPLAARLW